MQWVSPWGWDGEFWAHQSDLGALALPRWVKPAEG